MEEVRRLYLGETFALSYTVTNAGAGDVPATQSDWLERIYFSADQFLDPSADRYVDEIRHTGALAAGQSYTVTRNPGNVSTTTTSTTATFTGLTNGTPYTFTVYATSEAGNGATASVTRSLIPMSLLPTGPASEGPGPSSTTVMSRSRGP